MKILMKTLVVFLFVMLSTPIVKAEPMILALVVGYHHALPPERISFVTLLSLGDNPKVFEVRLSCFDLNVECGNIDHEAAARLTQILGDTDFLLDKKPLVIEISSESSCAPKNCPLVITGLGRATLASCVSALLQE